MAGKSGNWILAIIVIAFLAVAFGWVALPNQAGSTTGQPSTGTSSSGNTQQTVVQQTISSTTLSLAPYDKFGAQSATVSVEGVVLRGGVTIYDANAKDSSITVNPSDSLVLVAWDDGQTSTTTGNSITTDSSNDWYGWIDTYQVPLTPSASKAIPLYKEGVYSTWTTNTNGSLNSASAQLDLSASSNETVEVTLKAPSLASFGDPYAEVVGNPTNTTAKVTVVFDYNTTLYSTVEILEGTSVGIPKVYLGTGDAAYELPYSSLQNGERKTFNLHLIVGSQAPVDGTADVNAYILDPALYYNSTAGSIPTGFRYSVNNEVSGADLGYAQTIATLVYVN